MGSPVTEDNTSYDEQMFSILDACDRGDVKRLGEFIISGGELKELVDSRGRNALHHCVRCRDNRTPEPPRNLFDQLDRIKCARIIVKTDSSFLTKLDAQGNSPMHLAVLKNDEEFIRAMLEFRPDLEIRTQACSSPTNSQGSQTFSSIGGRTVIHLAVLHAKTEILQLLLEMDASGCINALDEQGATALHYAVQLSSEVVTEVIGYLAENGKADLNACDLHGRTALSWAATIGASEAVTQLLKHGAKLNVTDECGLTALHCAASRGNREIVQAMLNWISVANMDDPSKMAIFRDVTDKDGCTPLFYSVTMGHCEVTKCLLDYGANVQVQDAKGRTLAHCLARLGAANTGTQGENQPKGSRTNKDVGNLHLQMSNLLASGLDPWITTNTGAAPLHEACLLRNVPFVRELAKLPTFSQHVDARDAQGHTALHLVVAASWSSDTAGLKLCECLLRNGANVNASTLLPQGGAVTSLDLAIMNENEENVKRGKIRTLLESYGAKTFKQLNRFTKIDETAPVEKDSSSTPHPKAGNTKTNNSPKTNDQKPVNKLGKSDKATTPILKKDLVDATVQSNSGTVSKSSSRTLVHSESNHKLKTHVRSVQTSRGSQTEFSVSVNTSNLSHETVDACEQVSDTSEVHSRKEVGIQSEVSTLTVMTRTKPVCSAGSVSSKTGSSKQSTTSSSASVRVDTPCSSTPEADGFVRPHRKSKSNSQIQSTPSRVKHPPYSQAYLERELPGILKRYLSQEEHLVSPLTGRSRMPKPTLSPYLIPLVPYTKPVTGFSRKAGPRPTTSHGSPKRKPLTACNTNHTVTRDSRRRTPSTKASTAQPKIGPSRASSAPTTWVLHPSNRQLVTQLINQCLDDPYTSHTDHGNQSGSTRAASKRRKSKSKTRSTDLERTTRSAMGGELSPIGMREEPDPTESTVSTSVNKSQVRQKRNSLRKTWLN